MNTTKPKYTPGPWGIEKTQSHNWIGPMRSDGVKINEIVCDTEREGLKRVCVARNDANARLIAAAPDLLEALELAREYVERVDSDISRDDLAQIDAAILKATT